MNFKEFIEQLMYAVITGILPIFTVYIVNLIKSKISENTSKLQNEQLEKYIEAANEAISLAVISTSQTYVDSIKKAGKFDETAQTEAKNMALTKAKELITEEAKEAIETIYSDFDEYLDNAIETVVRENKTGTTKSEATDE